MSVEFFAASQPGKGSVEQADSFRGLSVFPPEWGMPEGRKFSPEREAWIRARVEETRRDPIRNLARTATRLRNELRFEELDLLREDDDE
jgi:hypothetical protein